ncbi:MAG: NAD(P)-dependent oxidoreductase [Myxococcota bacterium]|nr:NAD(P)-dependent oxidoreductase [Myxococcota bacterium]
MARVLLLGASGRLGSALASLLEHCETPSSADLCLRNTDALARRIDELEPEVLINCAGMTDVDGCDRDPQTADELNGFAPGRLARRCASAGVTLVHISTDYVFSGHPEHNHLEEDKLDPVNRYGQSKARGEGLVLDSGAKSLVARVQWLFGGAKSDFTRFVRGRVLAGQPVPVVSKQIGTPSFTADLALQLQALIHLEREGILHLANGGEASRMQQAQHVAEQLGVKARFKPVTWQDLGASAPRPERSVLDTTRLRALLAFPQQKEPDDPTGLRAWDGAQADYLKSLNEENHRG